MAITQAQTAPAAEDTEHAVRSPTRGWAPGATTGAGAAAAPRGWAKGGAKHGRKGAADASGFTPVPVWFFVFEGLMGASYDVVKSYPGAWMLLVACGVVNLVLARTVLRGRLKMAKAILKGKRTRKLALGLVALRIGVHLALGAAGMQATSEAAHIGLALAMCAATVWLLAFDQRVMLRALAAS